MFPDSGGSRRGSCPGRRRFSDRCPAPRAEEATDAADDRRDRCRREHLQDEVTPLFIAPHAPPWLHEEDSEDDATNEKRNEISHGLPSPREIWARAGDDHCGVLWCASARCADGAAAHLRRVPIG